MSGGWIDVRGARTHNLRNVSVRLPRGKLIAIAGVSGSGKSALAFGTLFAEGQRRYLECAAPFARSLLDALPEPDVDEIAGLPPTLAVRQHAGTPASPRATVGSLSEIAEFLRTLFARRGLPSCPRCGREIRVRTPDEIVDEALALPEGTKLHVLAPLARGLVGDGAEPLRAMRREGFVRARIDGTLALVDADFRLDPARAHDIDLVVDRQIVRAAARGALVESVRLAAKHGDGAVALATLDDELNWVDRPYSLRFACPSCRTAFAELEPRLFNPNSPRGACPACDGLGRTEAWAWEAIVPDPARSVAGGALAPFRGDGLPKALAKAFDRWSGPEGFLNRPWAELPAAAAAEARSLAEAELARDVDDDEALLGIFRAEAPCGECGGAGLNAAARSVRLSGKSFGELAAAPLAELAAFVAALDGTDAALAPLRADVRQRLGFLLDVGVGYLSLDRRLRTLSGGETQRVRLAACVGNSLRGACYILDEPTAGLHSRDAGRLLDAVGALRDRGNTVVVVEHNAEALRRCDWLVELGPGAGRDGGQVVHAGPLTAARPGACATADFLAGRRTVAAELPNPPGNQADGGELVLSGVCHRNLRDVTLRLPLRKFVALAGVSGSGKSTLAMEVLLPAVRRALGLSAPVPGRYAKLAGVAAIRRIVAVDQAPIGRTPRASPATFVGILEGLRKAFAATPEAKARGFGAPRFSYLDAAGRCAECKGWGFLRAEGGGLAEEEYPCPACRGGRYNPATSQVKFKGLSIAEALALDAAAAAETFGSLPAVAGPLRAMLEAGLGHLVLGQSATTLSGGEAQRLKLAAALAATASALVPEPTLFVLDEPTAGLHMTDVAALLALFRRLVAAGHAVLAIEHHLDALAAADWVAELGPGGGPDGGRLLFAGTPAELARQPDSPTGACLAARSG